MSGDADRDRLARVWLRRWGPGAVLLAVAMAAAALIFGDRDGEPANETRRSLPWQASIPLIYAIYSGMGWIDWRTMRRHPEDPTKWFGNRGRRA